ncbi:hypothetical protein MLD38_008401 [Melastoma candidum]|uniref:Uncharacterized protein n=1 Tax=Melastoma candidum TaxID=119954 RepID=A0ACB9RU65_9MYRT|nr:hypothetical protein MLD38_008401 [Melastoma candidum]
MEGSSDQRVPPPVSASGSTSRMEGHETESRDMSDPRSSRASHLNVPIPNFGPSGLRDDVWSCLVVLVTFWFFASMTLIFGFYGSVELELGPSCSRLIQTNTLFVQSIKVDNIDDSKQGPTLYGFSKHPTPDVESIWNETHSLYIPVNFHKEWIHFLNRGSRMEIFYKVKSSLPLSLVIAQGRESLIEWVEDPSYPNSTLSWNIISGMGTVRQGISKSSSYHIAVGNLNSEEVEVELTFRIKALLYNTTRAYYKCFVGDLPCSLKLSLIKADAAVLTSPSFEQGTPRENGWFVEVSYGPRWITYFVGSGFITLILLGAFRFCNVLRSGNSTTSQGEVTEEETERSPLLMPKDEEVLSLGSSYESVSQDECDMEEGEGGVADGEMDSIPRRQCIICYNAPRDCFFLPCGHSAACFDCGSRIAEEAGRCPICRRRMKKVRKIFSV